MDHRIQATPPDAEFFRNTGLALVFLTLLAGSISLFGSLAFIPAHNPEMNSYGIEQSNVTEVTAAAD